MELAYRLAVDESPYIREIRDGMITLITPVVEVDGRDRMVDIYRWHLAHPKDFYPPLIYWGKYVAHDNNRDAMGVTLKLTENVLNTYVGWKAQVLHDLHESVPYLYDNTAGDGPFNAWVDPILTDEWEMIGWRNVADMTKFGMPGVFHPRRFRHLVARLPDVHRRDAQRHQPPLRNLWQRRRRYPRAHARARRILAHLVPRQILRFPKSIWSQRDNNNYEETGLLTSLHYFNENKRLFLKNFYLKAKRSVIKPQRGRPRRVRLARRRSALGLRKPTLLRVMQKQAVEISRATAAFTVTLPAKNEKKPRSPMIAMEKEEAPPAPTTRELSRRQLHHPHGPALFPHRRRSSRLSILEPRRSAENAL